MSVYKDVKSLDQLVDYLKKHKNIVFNKINENQAEDILLFYNYINVITPFKYKFAKKYKYADNNKDPFKNINGVHVYEQKVDFHEYYNSFLEERASSKTIRENIHYFEIRFKSISTYLLLNEITTTGNTINNKSDLEYFINTTALRAVGSPWLNKNFTNYYIEIWKKEVNRIAREEKTIFLFFDRLSLGQWEILVAGLDTKIQELIFNKLRNYDLVFKTTNFYDFIIRYKIVREFRNVVSHNNSLRVLIRYRDRKRNIIRYDTERRKYDRLYNALCKEDYLLVSSKCGNI